MLGCSILNAECVMWNVATSKLYFPPYIVTYKVLENDNSLTCSDMFNLACLQTMSYQDSKYFNPIRRSNSFIRWYRFCDSLTSNHFHMFRNNRSRSQVWLLYLNLSQALGMKLKFCTPNFETNERRIVQIIAVEVIWITAK